MEESRFSIGMASSRSKPLPCGTPSMISISTTSASSLAAIQWAAVAPTLPEPTIVTFLRMNGPFLKSLTTKDTKATKEILRVPSCPWWLMPSVCSGQYSRAHVFYDVIRELAGLDLGSAFHQPLKVVGNFFLLDGAFQSVLHQVCRFIPSQEAQHHHSGENYRPRVDDIFIRILRSRPVGGFKTGVAIADVGARSDAQPAHLRRAGVGNVVSVQVRRGQYGIFIGSGHDLLEDGIGNPVVDHEFLPPRPLAMRGINRFQNVLDFLVDRLPEVFRGKLHARFDERSILLNRNVGVFILVAQNPALALGHHLVAKLLGRQLVNPLAERSLGKFLDISLVHQGHTLAAARQGELDRHPHQSLGTGN